MRSKTHGELVILLGLWLSISTAHATSGAIFPKAGLYLVEAHAEKSDALVLNAGTSGEIRIRLQPTEKAGPESVEFADLNVTVCVEIKKPCSLRCEGRIVKVKSRHIPPATPKPYSGSKPLTRKECEA